MGHSDIGQKRPCVPFLQHGIIGCLEGHLSAQDRIHAHTDRPHVGAGAKAALGDLQWDADVPYRCTMAGNKDGKVWRHSVKVSGLSVKNVPPGKCTVGKVFISQCTYFATNEYTNYYLSIYL